MNITAGKQRCVPCRQVSLYQKVLSKHKKDETPSKKLKRACVNSRCPIVYLTPKTKKKRLRAGTKMRIYYCRKAEAYAKTLAQSDVFIDNTQSNELENVVNIVRRDYDDVVEEVIKDSSNVDTQRTTMRQIWNRDCTRNQAKETLSKKQASNDVSNNRSR